MKRNLLIICCGLFVLMACVKQSSKLEEALILSGKNRIELERVLSYYSKTDSLKYDAAVYLIENMPGHYTYDSVGLRSYREDVLSDSLLNTVSWSLKNIFLGYPYLLSDIVDGEKKEDINFVTSDYLINNIECAFKVWKEPWASHLTFEEFCEYILPYRVGNERLEYWRDSLLTDTIFREKIKWILKVEEYHSSSFWACSYLNDELFRRYKEASLIPVNFTHALLPKEVDVSKWTCYEFSFGTIAAMRAWGIPVCLDFIPQWASRRNPHYWNVVLNYNKKNVPFVGFDDGPTIRHKPDIKMAKVYRRTYAHNPTILSNIAKSESVPPFFSDPFHKDVTREYLNVYDIEIELIKEPSCKRQISYLCVFDNQKWVPVHWGEIKQSKVVFNDVGTEIVCIAGYWIDGEIEQASQPFLITNQGHINYLCPDQGHQLSLQMTRKYPLSYAIVSYGDRVLGSIFEASNVSDFSKKDTIYTVTKNCWGNYGTIVPSPKKRYRYIRMKRINKAWSLPMAELRVYGGDSVLPLRGELIVSPKEDKEAIEKKYLLDNNVLTRMNIRNWAGIDLGKSTCIDSILYLTAHDDNNIVPGQLYELFYWDGIEKISLGKKKARNNCICYDSVPANALYLLSNHTKGMQERIFTFENGRIVFW